MRWIFGLVGLALFSSPGLAQNLGGIQLGMSESSAAAAIGGMVNSWPGGPSERIIFTKSDELTVWTCKGFVSQIKEKIGISLYDFAIEYNQYRRLFGEPKLKIEDVRGRFGPGAYIQLNWDSGGIRRSIQIASFDRNEDKIEVYRAVGRLEECR
jgi:hypothetical protein